MAARTLRRHAGASVVGSPVAPRSLARTRPLVELLRREPQLGRDDERLEQALADRRAEEQVPGLELDRQVDAQRPDERTRVGSGRDHDGTAR